MESYVRFTVSGVSGTVTSVKLRVYASSGTADGPAVYATLNTWSETGLTWSNRPARTSGAVDDKAKISTGTWVEYDVTSLVAGNGTYSFILAGLSTDGANFHSRENVNRPELVITSG